MDMPQFSLALLASFALTTGGVSAAAAPACTVDGATGTTVDRDPFVRGGYGLHVNEATHRLAYMAPDADGYYRIITMRDDKSDMQMLTANLPSVPKKHQGSPMWHPSGRYILFIAQKAAWSGRKLFGIPDYEALPGYGRHDDLWLARADGSQAWKLIDDANTPDEGILIPIFSRDGTRIAWSARQAGGTYVLRVADFVDGSQPHLANIRSYTPGNASYYEPGSFTSDGKGLVYATNANVSSFWQSQIDRLDLDSGSSVRLTKDDAYNEHPIVVATPGGDWVIYMSTKDVRRRPLHIMLGTDWWAMRIDGSGAKRLTTMNAQSGNPEDMGTMQVAGRVAIFASGDGMFGDVQDSLVRQTGLIRTVHFVCR